MDLLYPSVRWISRQVVELNPKLPALKIGIDRQHTVHDEMAAGEDVGLGAIEADIGGASIGTDPTLEQAAIEDDLARGIGILDLINAVAVAIDVGIEPFAAHQQIVTTLSFKSVRPTVAGDGVDQIITSPT